MASYDIGVADIRVFSSVFNAADAERIVAATGKKPRHDPQRTAEMLNWALTGLIAGISVTLAAPPSKQKARARRLQTALGQALQLMGLNTDRPPTAGGDFASAYQLLLPAGGSASLATARASVGFPSFKDAIWQGMMGLWFFQQCAAAARAHWEAHPEKTRHKPEPMVMAWATTMADTFVKVVDAETPKSPTTESPFIKFCEEIRVHLIKHPSSSGDPVIDAFRATLKRVRPAPMAAFITRHFKEAPQRIRRSTRSNPHRRISRRQRPK